MADHDDDTTPDPDASGGAQAPEAGATAEPAGDDGDDEAVTGPEAAGDDGADEAEDADEDADDTDGEGTTDEGEASGAGADADGTDRDDAEAGAGSGEARPAWVVPFLVGVAVVAVLAVVAGLVLLGGDDDGDDGAAGDEAAEADAGTDDDAADTADTTVGSSVPPVTTAPGTPTAGLLSELPPVGDAGWEPAGDGVTIGGAAYAETVVSGPIGPCDDGEARTVTYDLGGAYTWLEGVVGLVDGTDTGLTAEIGFEVDGEQVWWKTLAEGESSRLQLDVSGVGELTVTATGVFAGVDAPDACVRAAYGDLTLR